MAEGPRWIASPTAAFTVLELWRARRLELDEEELLDLLSRVQARVRVLEAIIRGDAGNARDEET